MNVPDTTTYFVAGYAVMLIGMAVYLVSLALRFRNLRQDEKMLEEVEEKDEIKPSGVFPPSLREEKHP